MNDYDGNWYYKADSTPHNTCLTPSDFTSPVDLTGLIPGVAYVYKAYSGSACADADYITEVYFAATSTTLTA